MKAILDHRKFGRTRQFLVHWEGYPDTDDSWVLERDIDEGLVRVYLQELENEMSNNTAHELDTQTTTPSSKCMGGGVQGRQANESPRRQVKSPRRQVKSPHRQVNESPHCHVT